MSTLRDAVWSGDTTRVRGLLEAAPRDDDAFREAAIAASANAEMAELFFERGFDPNTTMPDPWSSTQEIPVLYAVNHWSRWSPRVIELFLARGFDPESRAGNDRPLIAMLFGGVLDHYDRPHFYTPEETSAFFRLAKRLIRERVHLDPYLYATAAAWGDLRWVQLLIDAKVPVGDDALAPWAFRGHEDGVRRLLKLGANPNGTATARPLMTAAGFGAVEIVRLLLAAGADPRLPDRFGRDAITEALSRGRANIVDELVSAAPSGPNTAQLVAAAEVRAVARVVEALDAGVDIDSSTPSGKSALRAAAQEGHVEVVRILLDRGASPSIACPNQRTALCLAANFDHARTVDLLLRHTKPDDTPRGAISPLGYAAWGQSVECVELLLAAGAEVDAVFTAPVGDGSTVLHCAAMGAGQSLRDPIPVFRALLEAGADLDAATKFGVTVESVLEAPSSHDATARRRALDFVREWRSVDVPRH